jgi:hypothetical protein
MKGIFNVLLFIGLVAACVSAYFFYDAHQLQQQGVHAQGKVTDLIHKNNKKRKSGAWYPEVTFNDENGHYAPRKSMMISLPSFREINHEV